MNNYLIQRGVMAGSLKGTFVSIAAWSKTYGGSEDEVPSRLCYI